MYYKKVEDIFKMLFEWKNEEYISGLEEEDNFTELASIKKNGDKFQTCTDFGFSYYECLEILCYVLATNNSLFDGDDLENGRIYDDFFDEIHMRLEERKGI